MTDDRLIIEVVYAQCSFGSLGCSRVLGSIFVKGANLTLFKYPFEPLSVTVLLDID